MSEYRTAIQWERGEAPFTDNQYSPVHHWEFDGGAKVVASASPQIVSVPLSDPAAVDPEEAFVVALSSCHMLWFLSIAAKRGFVVDWYADHAIGRMEEDEVGRLTMTRVVLRPNIRFSGSPIPTRLQVQEMHEEAHQKCFIANSVKTVVSIEKAGSV